ncbi:MAG: hypothetical protein ACI88C_000051 [Acidimicrobiales bacterium]|jgi:hypothetical protein
MTVPSATNLVARNIVRNFLNKSPSGDEGVHVTMYVSASTTTPTDAGGNVTEPAAVNGYARVTLTNSTAWNDATDASPSVATSAVSMTFGPATGLNWGAMSHLIFHDDLSAGNALWTLEINSGTPVTIDIGDSLQFDAGNVQITCD